jgi:hypothetical protein
MLRVRPILGPIAAVWLVCQAATLTLVPVLIDASLAACTCANGADAACPMHHGAAAGSKMCLVQSIATSATATLNSLVGILGVVPPRPPASALPPTASVVSPASSTTTERRSPPDSPPPRA